MIREAFRGMHPGMQVVFFSSLVLTGTALVAAGSLYAGATLGVEGLGNWDTPAGRHFAWWVQGLNQLIAFGGASALFAWLFGGTQVAGWVWRGVPRWTWWAAGALLIAASQPGIDLALRLNSWILSFLPDGPLLQWAQSMESATRTTTLALLDIPDVGSWLATMVVVAVLPAVCEELAFRGVLQPVLGRWARNVHVGVWGSALLFSAIHLQFEGFLPRMLLGALLGYVTLASGSLAPAMLGHAVNNGTVVVAAYLWGPDYVAEQLDAAKQPWDSTDTMQALVSTVVFVGVGWWMWRHARWQENRRRYLEVDRS